ncbi:hypothetical protein [Fischerella sp.]|nr:hypothetical protein [Fischerella sp.]
MALVLTTVLRRQLLQVGRAAQRTASPMPTGKGGEHGGNEQS